MHAARSAPTKPLLRGTVFKASAARVAAEIGADILPRGLLEKSAPPTELAHRHAGPGVMRTDSVA